MTDPSGHVYILKSPSCDYVKIGGTDHIPSKRLREINTTEPYRQLGPWTLHDFRQVTDWRKVERSLHYIFRSQRVNGIEGQRELFEISTATASEYLERLDTSLLVKKPVVDRMFQDHALFEYLSSLFRTTAILNWLDLQGAWTFTLFPSTNGGRYFTLNIGLHEVAFTTLASNAGQPIHMIYMDRLIQDFDEPVAWVHQMGGEFSDDHYNASMDGVQNPGQARMA